MFWRDICETFLRKRNSRQSREYIKLMFFETSKFFWRNFPLNFWCNVKTNRKMSSSFVAFSEHMNFTMRRLLQKRFQPIFHHLWRKFVEADVWQKDKYAWNLIMLSYGHTVTTSVHSWLTTRVSYSMFHNSSKVFMKLEDWNLTRSYYSKL